MYVWFKQDNSSSTRSLIIQSDNLVEIAKEVIDEIDTFWFYTHDSLEEYIEEHEEEEEEAEVDIASYLALKAKIKKNEVKLDDIWKCSFTVNYDYAWIQDIFDEYADMRADLTSEFPLCGFADYDGNDETEIKKLVEKFNDTYGV